MSSDIYVSEYTLGEEIAHAVTHGLGAALSVAGLVLMVVFAAIYGDAWHVTSCSIYGSTLIILYTASTLYHGITHPKAKQILRQIDHAAIYLLIAGTYTPFTLVNLRGAWGWTLFAMVWGLALIGMAFTLSSKQTHHRVSLALYLGMGWLVLVAIKPMLASVDSGGMILLLLGGLSYSLGVIFYLWEKLPFNHAIWHVFVMAGSLFHFFAVFFYVVPDSL